MFSLAELECCVIRGKLSSAVNIKPPLVNAAKKSRPYLQYALDAADNRVNFYLVSGIGCRNFKSCIGHDPNFLFTRTPGQEITHQ